MFTSSEENEIFFVMIDSAMDALKNLLASVDKSLKAAEERMRFSTPLPMDLSNVSSDTSDAVSMNTSGFLCDTLDVDNGKECNEGKFDAGDGEKEMKPVEEFESPTSRNSGKMAIFSKSCAYIQVSLSTCKQL